MSADMEEDELVLSEGEDGLVEDGHPEDDGAPEHEEQIVPCPLTQELVNQSLSLLCRTGNGLAHAFVKMDLKDRQLTDISLISSFVHLRFLDISSNHMSDLSPLSALTHLLWLNVDRNMVTQLKGQPLGQLTFLQWLSLALNKLTDLDGLGCPALESLNLTGNGIQRVSGLQFNRLTNLVTLELRGNCLETTDGIYLPNLQRLYLAQNSIKHLEGLDKLERLTTLHLRDNQLETLDGMSPNMKSLQYLNVRGNLVSKQRALRSLWAVSKTLRALVLSENPLSEKEDYRMYVLSHLPVLERLDKEPISPEEKAEAIESMEELENEGAAEREDR